MKDISNLLNEWLRNNIVKKMFKVLLKKLYSCIFSFAHMLNLILIIFEYIQFFLHK